MAEWYWVSYSVIHYLNLIWDFQRFPSFQVFFWGMQQAFGMITLYHTKVS